MEDFSEAMDEIRSRCKGIIELFSSADYSSSLDAFVEAAAEAEKSWSGSWLGYHSRVYYEGLQPVPPGARFSQEWGFNYGGMQGTQGDWVEFSFDDVYDAITKIKGVKKKIPAMLDEASKAKDQIEEIRDTLLSLAESSRNGCEDTYLDRVIKDIEKCKVFTPTDYVESLAPSGKFFSRDMPAIQAGITPPPHVCLQARVLAIKSPKSTAESLSRCAAKIANHLANKSRAQIEKNTPGTHVFIGHGRSLLWKDLKDFLAERLNLPYDEFNRVPVAGVTNIARLSEMLNSAAIAFIVMTAEDEQADGKLHARMNVIHEAGLFQGRLGFTKAIVLLESECEEFSNIQGLGQIRFEAGNIKSCFEEVRLVLEREGLV